jgi:hypothetical protein
MQRKAGMYDHVITDLRVIQQHQAAFALNAVNIDGSHAVFDLNYF